MLTPVLIAWAVSLSAENITRKQADVIVLNYLQYEMTQPYLLFVNTDTPDEKGFVITTYQEETARAKHACWAYFVYEKSTLQPTLIPTRFRYLLVKEDSGSLMEIITSNDAVIGGAAWQEVDIPTGLVDEKNSGIKQLYPNPVDDLLFIPCNNVETRVEIYDLKGARLFSGALSGEDTCQLNVSFLSAGVYMVNVSGEMYKIIKK